MLYHLADLCYTGVGRSTRSVGWRSHSERASANEVHARRVRTRQASGARTVRVWQRRQSAARPSDPIPTAAPQAYRAQRLAWGVISGAFLVFCALLTVGSLTA